MGIHGLLFYELEERKSYYPTRSGEDAINPNALDFVEHSLLMLRAYAVWRAQYGDRVGTDPAVNRTRANSRAGRLLLPLGRR